MTVIKGIATWALTLLLAACGGGYEGTAPPIDASSQPLKVVGATSVTLVPTEMGRLEITGGTRPYTATSSNAAVALASISDNILSVAAVRGDLTPITVAVTDAKNAKTTLTVTVTNSPQQGSFVLSERVFSVAPGGSRYVSITGGAPPFSAVSLSPAVAGVSIFSNGITISGLSEGVDAEVKVLDSKGTSQSMRVTVAAPMPSASGLSLFSNIPSSLGLRPRSTTTYTLGGGIPPYNVTSSNPAVLSGSIRGSALYVTSGLAGNALLTISDSASPPSGLFHRIYVMTSSAPLILDRSAATADVGSTVNIRISGGMPPYTAITTATTLIGSGVVIAGDQLQLTGQFVGGPATVTVRDSEGATAKIDFTATSALSNLSASPSAVTISELLTLTPAGLTQATVIPVRVLKGKPPYKVFTSYPWLLRATVNGDTVLISTLSDGVGFYAPCVEADTVVAITIIDATNASADVAVTIKDNGLVCPR